MSARNDVSRETSCADAVSIEGFFSVRGIRHRYLIWLAKEGTEGAKEKEAKRARGVAEGDAAAAQKEAAGVQREAEENSAEAKNSANPLNAASAANARRAREGAAADNSLAPIVLLHGFSQRAESWGEVAALLARNGRTVYAFDLAGHGKSDRPGDPTAYSLEAQASVLRAFLRWVAQGQQVSVNKKAVTESDGEIIVNEKIIADDSEKVIASEKVTDDIAPFIRENVASNDKFADESEKSSSGRKEKGAYAFAACLAHPSCFAPSPCFASHVLPTGSVLPVVVGYSMGGRVALAALAGDPDGFSRSASALVLESAGLGPLDEAARAQAARRDADNAARLRREGVDAFMDAWEKLPLFATQQELPPSVRAHLAVERRANDAEALARTFEQAGQHAMPSRGKTLAALESAARVMPVHYATGVRDEKYRALADVLAARNISVHVIEGAGHNTHLESPAAFVEVLVHALPVENRPLSTAFARIERRER